MEGIVAKQANARYHAGRHDLGQDSRTASTVRPSDARTFSTARRHENKLAPPSRSSIATGVRAKRWCSVVDLSAIHADTAE